LVPGLISATKAALPFFKPQGRSFRTATPLPSHGFYVDRTRNLTNVEMAAKLKVSVRKVKAWEHDQIVPTADEWRVLESILNLDFAFTKS
jgi:hypothetical protein